VVLVVVGPTAVGKSEFALRACERFQGELLSVDSMQVYRGLDAGTGKPDAAERRRAAHHGIDLAPPGDDFSLGDFVRYAERTIAAIGGRERLPVLVGGTGLYLRGLLRGIVDAPRRDATLRARLARSAERRGEGHLHRLLRRVDPEAAARLATRDRQRVVRALEVYFASRRGLSDWIRGAPFGPDRYDAVKIGLDMDREALYRRIDTRVERFFRNGLVEEVRRLLAEGCPRGANALKALGYRESLACLAGERTPAEAIALTRRNTRRYAKRQLTWFRAEPGVAWFRLAPDGEERYAAPLRHAERELAQRGYRWREMAGR
jgi:tRNA dimethylallyltransferase